MRPLAELRDTSALRGVFCDIDDTLTTEGRLTAHAYAALEALKVAGKLVVPITGRPAGWCDHIARMWPVDAVVGENGAFYFQYDDQQKKLLTRYRDDDATRIANRARLSSIRGLILKEVPGCAVASDQLYRAADLAIDFCEDVPRLPDAAVDRIVAIMRESGMSARISSIHVNGWFGGYDKLGMTRTLMRERFSVDLDADKAHYVFVGDSPNDAPLFGYFPNSVGVANVVDLVQHLEAEPAYITTARAGAGFVELVAHLLKVSG